MAIARSNTIREGAIGTFHCWSRCCQRSYLLGFDSYSNTDYSHRQNWIESRLRYLSGVFAVDVGNFHLLSNHLHLILSSRPDVVGNWSDEEVVWRWKLAWGSRYEEGEWVCEPGDDEIEEELSRGARRIEAIRTNLSSISWFMARLKQPIARMANLETESSGHFWEQRFGARELTDDHQIFTAMIYNDLQQVKAGTSNSLESSRHSAFQRRFDAWRREQAILSREEFERCKAGQGLQLELQVIEDLLAASWLTPMSPQSPLLQTCTSEVVLGGLPFVETPGGVLLPKSRDEATFIEAGQAGPSTTEDAEEDEAEQEVAEAGVCESVSSSGSVTRGRAQRATDRTRSRKTMRIHKRLRQRLRRRRRDRPLLPIDWEQYMTLAKRLERRIRSRRSAILSRSTDPRKPAESVPATSTASTWIREIRDFSCWLQKQFEELPVDLIEGLQPRGDPG